MRKVILNRWFLLAALLMISLSAFSVIAYKKTRQVCTGAVECKKPQSNKGEMLWDAVSRQFSSFVSVQ